MADPTADDQNPQPLPDNLFSSQNHQTELANDFFNNTTSQTSNLPATADPSLAFLNEQIHTQPGAQVAGDIASNPAPIPQDLFTSTDQNSDPFTIPVGNSGDKNISLVDTSSHASDILAVTDVPTSQPSIFLTRPAATDISTSSLSDPQINLIPSTSASEPVNALSQPITSLDLSHFVDPTLFLDIPQNTPLDDIVATHLTPDSAKRKTVTLTEAEASGQPIEYLIKNQAWRTLAQYARQQITITPKHDVDLIMKCWYARALSLVKLRHFHLLSAEFEKIGDFLKDELKYEHYPSVYPNRKGYIIPFPLILTHAQIPALSNRPLQSLDRYYRLLFQLDNYLLDESISESERHLFFVNKLQVLLHIISVLISIKDYVAANKVMKLTLELQPNSLDLMSAFGRVHLHFGNLLDSKLLFTKVDDDLKRQGVDIEKSEISLTNSALYTMAIGNWDEAIQILQKTIKLFPKNTTIVNNLSVANVYAGSLTKAIGTLESLFSTSPSQIFSAEPMLFNLSTLYELATEDNLSRKRGMMSGMLKWAGDGVGVECLKL